MITRSMEFNIQSCRISQAVLEGNFHLFSHITGYKCNVLESIICESEHVPMKNSAPLMHHGCLRLIIFLFVEICCRAVDILLRPLIDSSKLFLHE